MDFIQESISENLDHATTFDRKPKDIDEKKRSVFYSLTFKEIKEITAELNFLYENKYFEQLIDFVNSIFPEVSYIIKLINNSFGRLTVLYLLYLLFINFFI